MIDWQAFQFLRPIALIGLLILPVLSYLLYLFKQNQTQWRSYIPAHLQSFLLIESKQHKSRSQYWLLALIWCVACLAIAGPTWEKLPQPVYQSQSGKVILADMSLSMRASDVAPDRLTRLRFKALDLLARIDDGEIALVAYAGDAFTISPLTEDIENIKNLIPSLSPEIMPVLGSNPYAALVEAKQLLENAGYTQGDIYWLTDGIAIEDIELIREFLDQNTVRLSVLLIGTERGAPIAQADGTLLKDNVGNIVIPKVDPFLFNRALVNSQARVIRMSADDSDISAMVLEDNIFSREVETSDEERSGDLWKDMGGYLILVVLPMVALLFRKGMVLCAMVMLMHWPSTEAIAQQEIAAPETQLSAIDTLFLNQNQRAQKHFQNESFQQAQEQFVDKSWKAAAAYKAGDYETASQLYGQLEGVDNLYNLGNSLANQGQLQRAISAYSEVINNQPDHSQAIANKKLLEDLLEQQENQDNAQNQQSQNQQQDQNSETSNEQSDSQQQSQNQEQSQQNQSNQEQAQNQSQQQSQPADADQNDESAQQESKQSQQQDNQQAQEQQQPSQDSMNAQNQETEDQQSRDSVVQGNIDPSQMTPEEREKMRQMQMLLNKIPDDPAFLLKRKMLVESQQRRQQGAPLMQQQIW
ncbi:MAG: VWA domain-containing protein [Pseudomonadota bacterium]